MAEAMERVLRRALPVLVVLLMAPASAGAVTYGLGDAAGTFARCAAADPGCCAGWHDPCPAGSLAGYWNSSLFRTLTGPGSAHRITQVRLFVTYDALQEWNGSTTAPGCQFSRVLDEPWYDSAHRLHPAGQSWDDLRAGLIAAHADGLTPVVSIMGYGSPAATPSWDQAALDPTSVAGYWGLRCGLRGILDALGRLPTAVQPHIWEALNEPDGFALYNGPGQEGPNACRVTPAGNKAVDGAAKAACVYALGASQIHAFAGHDGDIVIPGVFLQPSPRYLSAYTAELASLMPGPQFPAIWSVHDYGDVTGSYAAPQTTPLARFDEALRADSGGRARELWVTEAGTELTDGEPDPSCASSPGVPGTLGACVNGQSARQVSTANAFFDLPNAGVAVPITHLFWYQWQGESNWDSGITDANGAPRAPWCAFYGSGLCTGDPSVAGVP